MKTPASIPLLPSHDRPHRACPSAPFPPGHAARTHSFPHPSQPFPPARPCRPAAFENASPLQAGETVQLQGRGLRRTARAALLAAAFAALPALGGCAAHAPSMDATTVSGSVRESLSPSLPDALSQGTPARGIDLAAPAGDPSPEQASMDAVRHVFEGGALFAGEALPARAEDDPACRDLLEARSLQKASQAAPAQTGTLRERMLVQAAQVLGFQQGFRTRWEAYRKALEHRSAELDAVFRFRPLLIDGRILPPVIRWAGRSVTIESDELATESEASFAIVEPARIVAAAPTWRDWLWADADAFGKEEAVLPSSGREKDLWREAVRTGWEEGRDHADATFRDGMARLVADFRGMLRFRLLADRGIVSVPAVARGVPVIRAGARTLGVGETVLRITVPAAFNKEERWLAPLPDEGPVADRP